MPTIRSTLAILLPASLALAACGDDGDATVDAGADAPPRIDAGPPAPPLAEPGRHDVTVVDTRQMIPGDGLPPETPAQTSNNNLDVIRHDGRVFLAWRTGPDHFASAETRIHVISSDDETTWRFEATFFLDRDLREPRFLSLGGSLFLYVSRLGTSSITFEPQGISVAERHADGTWTGLEEIFDPGWLLWRARTEAGTPMLLAYLGGEHIYDFSGLPISVGLFTTADGRTLTPLDPARAVVWMGGGSETDLALQPDGSLLGVIRNEAGEATGFGSKVCQAPAGDLARWTCVDDPRKYDSPLVFYHDGETYLLARRNVTETGNYDLMRRHLTIPQQEGDYQLDYVRQPKRCALWRFVPAEQRIAFILDLPSRGDTCFPALITGATADELVVYNYSSDIDGSDVWWNVGQVGPTFIYRHVLRFTVR